MPRRLDNRMQKVLIRCDASPLLGLGHWMRCATLATELRKKNIQSVFAIQKLTPAFSVPNPDRHDVRWIERSRVHTAPSTLPFAEAEWICRLAKQLKSPAILLDHYGATPEYMKILEAAGLKIGVIDDLADRNLSHASWILNQNLNAEQSHYETRSHCVKLLGPSYALLRQEFPKTARAVKRRFKSEDNHVLVSFGGGDMQNMMRRVLSSLVAVKQPIQIHAFLNASKRARQKIKSSFHSAHHQLTLTPQTREMAKQMAWCDLSLNAAGSTVLELMCMGIPMIAFCLSDNQKPNFDALKKNRCAVAVKNLQTHRLTQLIEQLLSSPARRMAMSRSGAALVDGRGASRAALSFATWAMS